jgi:phosphoribosylanthranilate isomerase
MLVKICGITNPPDAQTAQEAGADFIGLVFVPGTRRCLGIEQARSILAEIHTPTRAVGLFVNEPPEQVAATVKELGLQVVQLHGQESPEYINELLDRLPECRVLKAFAVSGPQTLLAMESYYHTIQKPRQILGFLLDAPGGGGMGKSFDWIETARVLTPLRKKIPPIFLAGGLTIGNISDAIRGLAPDGVDVSSGVEAAPGQKDPDKVRLFIRLAKNLP